MTDKLVKKCLLTDEEIRELTGHTTSYEPTDSQINYSLREVRKIAKAQLIHAIPIIAEEIKRELEKNFTLISMPSVDGVTYSQPDKWYTFWERYKGG